MDFVPTFIAVAVSFGAGCAFVSEAEAEGDTDTDTDTDGTGTSSGTPSGVTTTPPTGPPSSSGSASSIGATTDETGTTSVDTSSTVSEGSTASSSSTTGVDVPEDAIAFYVFEGDAEDQTGNGHDGVLVGAIGFAAGRYGMGVRNDGEDGHVEIDTAPELDLLDGYTVEAWVRPGPSPSQSRDVISKGDTPRSYTFRVGMGVPAAPVSASMAPCSANPGPPGLVADEWVHVAWTWDGATMRSYLDAVELDATACALPMMIVGGPLYFLRNTGTDFWLAGDLDHVAIFGEARDASQICEDGGGEWAGGCSYP